MDFDALEKEVFGVDAMRRRVLDLREQDPTLLPWVAFWHLEQEGFDVSLIGWCRHMQVHEVSLWMQAATEEERGESSGGSLPEESEGDRQGDPQEQAP